jgi:glycosyltransferase involved in cell wall biosynthesis
MRVIEIPYCFHPDPVGGTEVYVEALAHELKARGIEVIVAAPGERDAGYEHNGLKVRRYGVGPVEELRELYGEGDAQAAAEFARILDEERPDLVHLHAFTRGVSLKVVRQAKCRKIPVVFTYHTPTVSCQRGTLLRWGKEVCDGLLRPDLCTACTLHGLGAKRLLAHSLARMPSVLNGWMAKAHLSGGIWTALRMRGLVELRHSAFYALMQEVDHIVVLAEWTRELLLRNGIPPDKLTLCRHGLLRPSSNTRGPQSETINSKFETRNGQSAVRIAFLGRLDPTKGPDLLVRAVRALPQAALELHLYGIVQGNSGVYVERLRALAQNDKRIEFRSPVPPEGVVQLLSTYDLVAVPSRWLETGPLVVLEAFAAGTPVLGSRLGGIAELVTDGVNGILVEVDSLEGWKEAIGRLLEDRTQIETLRRGIRPPRSIEEVADEMIEVYARLCQFHRIQP